MTRFSDKIFFSLTLLNVLVTDTHLKFLSDAQLDTLRKIPCKFQLNPSSRLGVFVVTRFFDFDDLLTYLETDGKIFVRCTTRGLKENSLKISA